MIYMKRLFQKVRYNNIIRLVMDVLVKMRIRISPFYFVVEGTNKIIPDFEQGKFSAYTVEYLSENDMKDIAKLEERPLNLENLLIRLKNGCRCLGIKINGEIAAFTWFDLTKCTFDGYPFLLKEYEAYMFDAYTLIKYRGEKIAPFVRYNCYKELQNMGRTTLYSISEAFNKQSINFKKKLGAKFVFLGLYCNFFNKWQFTIPLKNLIPKDEYARSQNLQFH